MNGAKNIMEKINKKEVIKQIEEFINRDNYISVFILLSEDKGESYLNRFISNDYSDDFLVNILLHIVKKYSNVAEEDEEELVLVLYHFIKDFNEIKENAEILFQYYENDNSGGMYI